MNKFATFFLMIEVFTVCMKTNDFLFLQQVICKKKRLSCGVKWVLSTMKYKLSLKVRILLFSKFIVKIRVIIYLRIDKAKISNHTEEKITKGA